MSRTVAAREAGPAPWKVSATSGRPDETDRMSGPAVARTVSVCVDVGGAADDSGRAVGAEGATPEGGGAGGRGAWRCACDRGCGDGGDGGACGDCGAAEHAATPADPRAPA